MKLSVAWIFDHIKDISWKSINIPDLVKQFGYKSAEIEGLSKVKTDLDNFTLVKITDISQAELNKSIKAYSQELDLDINLSIRSDINLNNIYLNNYYLVKKSLVKNNNFSWATLEDLGSSKEGLLTDLFVDIDKSKDLLNGSWKKEFEQEDYILSIDNIAVSNRPDMWGHRGVAREFAALLDADLVTESEIFQDYKAANKQMSQQNTFSVKVDDLGQACKRFSGLYIEQIENRASDLKIATRLARIDSRPINLVVDTTNYVMFDISQPMHAFDSDAIKSKKVVTRYADKSEKIKLLDKTEVELTTYDYIITDGGEKPIALAGIMGGLDSGVNLKTDSIFLESANFDPDMIRKTSARVKKRTEASARFEKSLDPNQNTDAILRFLKLITKLKVKYKATESIISLGELAKNKSIKISYDKIIELIGVNRSDVSAEKVKSILEKLGFKVEIKQDISENKNSGDIFIITVPTFRSTKDVTTAQDIVEEVARFIGYSAIELKAPVKQMESFDTSYVMNLRDIKKHVAFAMKMREVQNYAFFDEEFLKLINYNFCKNKFFENAIEIANPQSENMKRLVTSLVPNLLKNIFINLNKENKLQFFENNRVWFTNKSNKSQVSAVETAVETVELAGIFFDSKSRLDFYEYKSYLNSLFDLLKVKVLWQKPKKDSVVAPWYDSNQFAELVYEDAISDSNNNKNKNNKINSRVIGRAGKVDQKFMNYISEGDAFIFELDSNFLINFKPQTKKFEPVSKYQEVYLDISIFVPLEISSDQIVQTIKSSDKKIESVNLIDFYQKEEWNSKRALTFRFKIVDKSKTLSKEEIDAVWDKVVKTVQNLGVLVR